MAASAIPEDRQFPVRILGHPTVRVAARTCRVLPAQIREVTQHQGGATEAAERMAGHRVPLMIAAVTVAQRLLMATADRRQSEVAVRRLRIAAEGAEAERHRMVAEVVVMPAADPAAAAMPRVAAENTPVAVIRMGTTKL